MDKDNEKKYEMSLFKQNEIKTNSLNELTKQQQNNSNYYDTDNFDYEKNFNNEFFRENANFNNTTNKSEIKFVELSPEKAKMLQQFFDSQSKFINKPQEFENQNNILKTKNNTTDSLPNSASKKIEIANNNEDKPILLPSISPAKKCVMEGENYYKNKQFNFAMQKFDEAIEIDVRCTLAYLKRGNAKFELKQYKEAEADYRTVLKLEPDNEEAKNNMECLQKAVNNQNDEICSDGLKMPYQNGFDVTKYTLYED